MIKKTSMVKLLLYCVCFSFLFDNSLSTRAEENLEKRNTNVSFSENNTKSDNENSKKIIWTEVINKENNINNKIRWYPEENPEEYDYINKTNYPSSNDSFSRINKKLYDYQIELTSFDLGRSVPTSYTLNKGDIQIKLSQIAPINNSYYPGGTGNQNYLASINYGLSDRLMIEAFYSHSDDPLHKKIFKYDDPIENRWVSYGTLITWQAIKHNKVLFSLNGSIENWNVKSGGCNTFNCNSSSNNIFTSNVEEVLNDNVIGSISLPITWNVSKKLDFNITPRSIFLPSNQSNGTSSGKFYGNSIGIGTGIEYKFYKNLKAFSSIYFPIGPGYNNFDVHLNFYRKNIYNAGIVYSLDTRFSIETVFSNGFGLSPSIATLTLPSSDQILYKTTLIYRPSNIELPQKKTSIQERLKLGGLSVSTAEPLNLEDKKVTYSLNNNGTWSSRVEWATSNKVGFDFAFSSIGQNSILGKTKEVDYHDTNKLFVTGGVKANFLNQSKGDLITSSARISAGRLRGWGWLITELANTYTISDALSLNVNPKFSFSGIASPSAIGTSLNWKIFRGISIIPEYNFALKESSDNWTIALRISKLKNKYIDLYTTNSLNFVDTGQLLRSDDQSYGFNIGFVL